MAKVLFFSSIQGSSIILIRGNEHNNWRKRSSVSMYVVNSSSNAHSDGGRLLMLYYIHEFLPFGAETTDTRSTVADGVDHCHTLRIARSLSFSLFGNSISKDCSCKRRPRPKLDADAFQPTQRQVLLDVQPQIASDMKYSVAFYLKFRVQPY
jgi:hypothetical protein